MSKYIKLEDALKGFNIGYGKYDYVSKVADYYYNLPTIEVRTGEWIPDPDGGFWCSNCRAEEDEFIYGTGMRYTNGESEFCPNCGAKMKGADNE